MPAPAVGAEVVAQAQSKGPSCCCLGCSRVLMTDLAHTAPFGCRLSHESKSSGRSRQGNPCSKVEGQHHLYGSAGSPTRARRPRTGLATRIATCTSWGGDHPSGHMVRTFVQPPRGLWCPCTACTQRSQFWELCRRVNMSSARAVLLQLLMWRHPRHNPSWLSGSGQGRPPWMREVGAGEGAGTPPRPCFRFVDLDLVSERLIRQDPSWCPPFSRWNSNTRK